jgi:hypothetical protein
MLSKVYSGHSFYHACYYVVNKEGAEVLEYEGIRGHDFKVMAEDFVQQQQMRPQKQQACFHCSLSFYPGEVLSDEKLVKIAKEYLEQLKIVDTQYAITKHTDRRHLHLHVLANMVNNNGKAISDSYIRLRGKKIAQQLTQQYQLVPALDKNLELTNLQALRPSEANKYEVYRAIVEAIPHCRTIEELEKRLQLKGIQTQYKYKGHTQEKQGISFRIKEDCFKGSQVDRKFSLGNLEKIMAMVQKQSYRPTHVPWIMRQEDKQSLHFDEPTMGKQVAKQIDKAIERFVRDMSKPIENYETVPRELIRENNKSKKRRQRHQH